MTNSSSTDTAPVKHRSLWWLLATWFGCGLSPIVSGTAGSLGALPFAFAIQAIFGAIFGNFIAGNIALCSASILVFLIGCWASNRYLAHTGRDDDPREIVIDEVAGQWLLLSFLFPTWQSYLVGFLVFRTFDIVKPWPISAADRNIKGGIGVMFDDVLAALYPALIFLIILVVARLHGSEKLLLPVINFLGGSYVH